MKIKLRFNRRHNTYITVIACAAALVMMVTRFGLPINVFLQYFIITLICVGVLLVLAALTGFLLKLILHRQK